MSLIHTCNLAGGNPFEYLTALQLHITEIRADPHLWMPWNYTERLSSSNPYTLLWRVAAVWSGHRGAAQRRSTHPCRKDTLFRVFYSYTFHYWNMMWNLFLAWLKRASLGGRGLLHFVAESSSERFHLCNYSGRHCPMPPA
jgi:hypothetical protein